MISEEQFLEICKNFRKVRKKTMAIEDAGVDLIEITDPLYGVTNILGENVIGKAGWGSVIDWIWENWDGRIYKKDKLWKTIKTDEELYAWLKKQKKINK